MGHKHTVEPQPLLLEPGNTYNFSEAFPATQPEPSGTAQTAAADIPFYPNRTTLTLQVAQSSSLLIQQIVLLSERQALQLPEDNSRTFLTLKTAPDPGTSQTNERGASQTNEAPSQELAVIQKEHAYARTPVSAEAPTTTCKHYSNTVARSTYAPK